MKYIDLHCDTVTALNGANLADFDGHVSLEKLNKSGCAAQCFAIFTQGADAALLFEKHLKVFKDGIKENGIKQVLSFSDLSECLETGKTGAILTVENLGFTDGDLSYIARLAEQGVKMASLVWNFENVFAYPNMKFCRGVPCLQGRERRGLKPLGREAVGLLDENKIIVDVSHLSDGGTDEILQNRKIPIVASHSNAAEVCGVCRNLTDGQIRKIAACGGVVGVNFCKDFLGNGETFGLVLRHIRRLIDTGGEDVVAFGSDFDGITAPKDLENCTKVPRLINYLSDNGITGRVLEKLCYKNFLRVFREVCG